jgi:large subunit ribosomal protein L25
VETKALTVAPREDTGKGTARKLRSSGMIPGVVYGSEVKPKAVAVSERELLNIFRTSESGNIIIDLSIEGKRGKPLKVLVKEVQKDPVEGELLHIDFQQISLTKKINVDIPIRLTGTAFGVKTMGGILEFIQRDVAVACLPTHIEDFIEVDVTELKIGDSIHAGDLDLERFDLLTNPNQVLVTIAAPTIVKIAEEAEAVEGEEGEEGEEKPEETEEEAGEKKEPEVIHEKKKKEK